MKLVKTLKIKISATAADVMPTITAYTKAFNHVCQVGFNKKLFNSVKLHNLTYHDIKDQLPELPTQLICSARNKAAEAVKGAVKKEKKYRTCPQSKLCSIRLDKNSYTLFLKTNEVSMATVGGRKKYTLTIANYHQEYFKDWKYRSADLCVAKNKVFLHIVFEKDITDTNPNGTFVGLDRGINNIAVISTNKFFTGKHVKRVSKRYRSLRSKLQKRGTKSAKRHLRKISGKERRFIADTNHKISKQIISSLNPGDTLVLENLKGIRNKRLRKTIRTLINNWSFYQLEQFLTYKANAKGISIDHVVARYTSQTCSNCGYCAKNNRKTQGRFECKECSFKLNADLNASRNIGTKALASYMLANGAVVNQPIVSV